MLLTTSAKPAKLSPAVRLPLTHHAPEKLLKVTVALQEITFTMLRGHFSIQRGFLKFMISSKFKVRVDVRILENCITQVIKGTDESNESNRTVHFIIEILFVNLVHQQF